MKYRIYLSFFSIAVICSLGSFGQVFACSCVSEGSVCEAFSRADAIFVGKVIGAKEQRKEKNENGKEVIFANQETYFQVTEAFFGVSNTNHVVLSPGYTTCDYPFEIGETYLVYAYSDGGKLVTSICTRTRPISKGGEDIHALRKLVKESAGTKISGSVDAMGLLSLEPIAEEKIKLVSVKGGFGSVETLTDDKGAYSFTGIPAGRYRIFPSLPNLTTLDKYQPTEFEVSGKGCEIRSFTIFNDSGFTGRLINSVGQSVPNAEVEFIPVNNDFGMKNYEHLAAWTDTTDKEGYFTFERIPIGHYFLAVNFKNPPNEGAHFPTTFYPNVTERSQAAVFAIKLGQKTKGILFTVPPPFEEIEISGTITREDGKTPVNLQVRLKDVGENHSMDISWAMIDDDGAFEVKGYEGRRYVFEAAEVTSADENTQIVSSEFVLTRNMPNFNLVMKENTK